jgi:hypothetical protein
MNRKFLTILILILIVGVGIWYWKADQNVLNTGDNTDREEKVVYTDPQGVFRFKYPSNFIVSGREGAVVASVRTPEEYLPRTNFSDTKLTINWAGGGTDATCSSTNTTQEAAAGNLYETTTVKKIYDGDCYTFEYVIHSTNIGNYDPGQGITEFDKAEVKEDFDDIIDSFEYLVNSD